MIKRERENGPTELESFANYFVRRAQKLAERMKIQKALDLSDRENQLAAIFLAERIAKASQYHYLQESKKILPARKGILVKIVEKIFNNEQELTNLACEAFEQASKTITEEELKGPRGQTIYLAINDLSARINQENDFWRENKHPLANYQLKEFNLWQWGIKWRGELEEIKEEANP
jgi:hypothetical protein